MYCLVDEHYKKGMLNTRWDDVYVTNCRLCTHDWVRDWTYDTNQIKHCKYVSQPKMLPSWQNFISAVLFNETKVQETQPY